MLRESAFGGQGLSAVDVHLLGSVLLVPEAKLWTRDERLLAVSREMGVLFEQ
ncbi:MAG TPA: hypothetical protein VFB19_20965 [Mycobacterium sp.]|nr:hypothetical protein [Mycobacterium sp.]